MFWLRNKKINFLEALLIKGLSFNNMTAKVEGLFLQVESLKMSPEKADQDSGVGPISPI